MSTTTASMLQARVVKPARIAGVDLKDGIASKCLLDRPVNLFIIIVARPLKYMAKTKTIP